MLNFDLPWPTSTSQKKNNKRKNRRRWRDVDLTLVPTLWPMYRPLLFVGGQRRLDIGTASCKCSIWHWHDLLPTSARCWHKLREDQLPTVGRRRHCMGLRMGAVRIQNKGLAKKENNKKRTLTIVAKQESDEITSILLKLVQVQKNIYCVSSAKTFVFYCVRLRSTVFACVLLSSLLFACVLLETCLLL